MKATGIVRRIDDLGRVVIPKEIRRTMRIREGDPLEIYTNSEGEVIFKKYSAIGEMSQNAGYVADIMCKIAGCPVVIFDKDHVTASAGVPKKEFSDNYGWRCFGSSRVYDKREVYRSNRSSKEPHQRRRAVSCKADRRIKAALHKACAVLQKKRTVQFRTRIHKALAYACEYGICCTVPFPLKDKTVRKAHGISAYLISSLFETGSSAFFLGSSTVRTPFLYSALIPSCSTSEMPKLLLYEPNERSRRI